MLKRSGKEPSLPHLPRPEYPRPQLRRQDWINLNGEWKFAFDDADVGHRQGWQRVTADRLGASDSPFNETILVPFCFQAKLSGIDDSGFHDVVWYARVLPQLLPSLADERLLLHFGAVDYRATVWVNSVQVAEHEGGHTPFSADITQVLLEQDNVLVVRVEDPSQDPSIPRGKQYWKRVSEGIFYGRTTGIWQTVWLEPVHQIRIEELRLTPDIDAVCLELEVVLTGVTSDLTLKAAVTREEEPVCSLAFTVASSQLRVVLPLETEGDGTLLALWSPEEPNLYDLRLEVCRADGSTTDSVRSYFGMRKIETRGGQVLLNNTPYYQRLVLDQGYFPEGVLTAPSDADFRRDIELAKEMGFNGARKHQKVEDPRWLYWADTLGFLVWGEMAGAHHFTRAYVQRITAEWQAVIRRDYNHPCIVVWVPINESCGARGLAEDSKTPTGPLQTEHLLTLYHLTRSLDKTRLVISNDGWEHAISDLCTIHDYSTAPELARRYATLQGSLADVGPQVYAPGYTYSGEPVLITEFGGILSGYAVPGIAYSVASDGEAFLRSYRDMVAALVQSDAIQGFCYTQLTDVEQEVNGLLTYDRKPKVDLRRVREITLQEKAPVNLYL